jgi:polysaccharide pyruvyl transferase WcaK-like protein
VFVHADNIISSLHADNGKEFIATIVVDLIKESNPNCFIVTGHPRTPQDQGSVESANKIVQQVLKSISSENRLRFIEVNWTKLLGQVMAVCNSYSGARKHSVVCQARRLFLARSIIPNSNVTCPKCVNVGLYFRG